MKLKFREEPKEWRKAVWLGLLGPAVIAFLLTRRGAISKSTLAVVLVCFALLALAAWLRPRWFRGYYRFAVRWGHLVSGAFGFVALSLLFFLVLTPLAFILRLCGKDLLDLKSGSVKTSYWQPSRAGDSLENLY